MFRNYFVIALRNLNRNKVFSFIHLAGLSLGLACCMLIFLYVKDELSFDRFHAKTPQLYQLKTTTIDKQGKSEKYAIAGMTQGPTFKRTIPEIEDFVRIQDQKLIVKKDRDSFYEEAIWADQNFFSVFSFPLLSGDPKTALKDIHSVVLTEEIAQKYFGSISNALGKTLELSVNDKFEPFVVSAIAKKSPQNSSIQFKMLLSFNYKMAKQPDDHWLWLSYPTFFVLNTEADLRKVEAKMNKVYQQLAGKEITEAQKFGYDSKTIYGLSSLASVHLDTELRDVNEGSNPIYSYILSGIALFILLIACINFVNLTVAQSLRRGKEIGIRKVSGSNRKQLIWQFMSESFLLCLLAFLFSFFIVELSLPFFNELANKQLSLSYLFDYQMIIEFSVLFVTTVVLAGFYPALVLSGFEPIKILYNRATFAGKNYFAKGLMVLQFSLATFMIIITFFVFDQFEFLTHKDLGYNQNNLVKIDVGQDENIQLMQVFKNEFSRIGGVESVAPRQVGSWGTVAVANKKELHVAFDHVDEDYIPTLGLKLVAGRNFSSAFPADSTTAVMVNETFMREAGWQPTDQDKTIDVLNGQTAKLKIIGVVKDYHFASLKDKIQPQVFTSQNSMPFGRFMLKLQRKNIPKTLRDIEKVCKKITPFRPIRYDFVDQLNSQKYESEAKWKRIIGLGALLMIFVACIGLFGLILLSIQQRAKEIGIRKVLGASVFQISVLVSSRYLKLVFVAFLVAIPASWFATNKWLENFAYKIELSWQTFAIAAMLTTIIASLTVSYQAIKAAMANPVKSLKTE